MPFEFKNISVLIAEESDVMRALIRAICENLNMQNIFEARNGDEAFAKICAHNPDVIIADMNLHPLDGLALTHLVRCTARAPNRRAIIILCHDVLEADYMPKAANAGANYCLPKPMSPSVLARAISQAIHEPLVFIESLTYAGPDRRRRDLYLDERELYHKGIDFNEYEPTPLDRRQPQKRVFNNNANATDKNIVKPAPFWSATNDSNR
jgi:two-component system chemotaxis response regulator CheY